MCVAAASGSVNPLPAAAQPVGTAVSRVSAVSTPYALTASSLPLDLINVASLPLQNAITIATATANLFTIVITTPNNVYKLIVAGQVDQVPAAIQAGIASEVAAIQTFVQLPATIITTDIAAIAGLFGGLGGAPAASTFATTNAPALAAAASPAAAASGLLGLVNVASLPLQNAITIATATANLFTIVVTTPNNVYKAIVSGQVDQVPAAIQAGIASEVAAIQTFLQLPATIIATDVAAIAGLFGGLAAPAASTFATTNAPTLRTAARTVDTLALTSSVEDPSASKTSAALTTSTADLPKTLPAADDSATGNAHTDVNGATSPDATEDEGKTTTTLSPIN